MRAVTGCEGARRRFADNGQTEAEVIEYTEAYLQYYRETGKLR